MLGATEANRIRRRIERQDKRRERDRVKFSKTSAGDLSAQYRQYDGTSDVGISACAPCTLEQPAFVDGFKSIVLVTPTEQRPSVLLRMD